MASAPVFSIIIPTYNRSKYLHEAITSIIQQTFGEWELIIVDDASTDDTGTMVGSFNDPRIVYLKNETNRERGYSRNSGIDTAKGKYICFLDSDDLFEPIHLQTFYNRLQGDSGFSGMLFCNSKLINQDTGQITLKQVPDYAAAPNIFAYLLQYTPNPARVCVTADVFKKFRFDATIPGLEDLDLWLHIATQFKIVHLHQYTSLYRVHDESYTTGDARRYEKELKNFKIIFDKPVLKNVLPAKYKNRLISMCLFHLSAAYEQKHEYTAMYRAVIKSYFLCPEGYNHRTNKILLVRFFYNLPVLGNFIKFLRKSIK